MKTNRNRSKRIYDKSTRTWYVVPEGQYQEFDRWRTNLRKREQHWGRCFCPRGKWWLCDGNCVDCEFHTRNEVSLDDPLPEGEGTRGDYVPDETRPPKRSRQTVTFWNGSLLVCMSSILMRTRSSSFGARTRIFPTVRSLRLSVGRRRPSRIA